jgi:hypothetical protein
VGKAFERDVSGPAGAQGQSSARQSSSQHGTQAAGLSRVDGERPVDMRGHEAEVLRHVADDNDLITARSTRLRQDQSMIDGSGETDGLFGLNPMDGIQNRPLPLMNEEWSIRIKIICECTVSSRYADTAQASAGRVSPHHPAAAGGPWPRPKR